MITLYQEMHSCDGYLQIWFILLYSQAKKETDEKVEGAVDIPAGDSSKEDVVKAVCENVKWQMDGDRKTTELKNLQGLIWREAYESGEVKGQ